LEVGKKLPSTAIPQPFSSPFFIRAYHDVIYHGAGVINPLFFPHYKTHAPVTAPIEYAGYLQRFSKLRRWQQQDQYTITQFLQDKRDFYLLPLQLSGDAQIRDHSCFKNMSEVIDVVMQSFARHAKSDARLVIKNHPLDMGLVNYRKYIGILEQRYAISGRVIYLETGDLSLILKQAAGTVTVNSTVGGLALEMACPTLALSDAIYNMAGLTFQEGLDNFWRNAERPDATLYNCFRNTVIQTTQINGGFYCKTGIDLAVASASPLLQSDKSALEQWL
jgi:capsular polysaccharide export protein